MCARYNLRSNPQALAEYFQSAPPEPPVTLPLPNFNVAPTQQAPVVLDGPRRFEVMRWGLVPFWAKDPRIGRRTINARAETVGSKPAFRAAFRRRRCLVPADGFYEWTGPRGKRQPLNIHRSDGNPLALAGLWESHDEFGPTFTIVTTAPNAYMSTIHSRMPVVLEPGDWNTWLSADDEDSAWRSALLRPAADHVLTGYPVNPAVNSVRNNGPHLLESTAIEPLL